MSAAIALSRRVRKTPFEDRVHEHGAKGFTVYNHMPLATVYRSIEEDYWHLREHVQLWDVACERQVEVRGPDALRLLELSTPRDVSKCRIGQCLYVPLCDETGGMVNDPLLLRVDDDRYWVSIADSDALLWYKGLAHGLDLGVEIFEPDVSPLALQGPKADAVLQSVLGMDVSSIRFFRFIETKIADTPVLVARSGWSGQGGFEIYLQDSSKGLDLWDEIWRHGEAHDIHAGCPNVIERIESGLLSYGSDMTSASNIFECGLNRFVELGKPAEYLSREALAKVAEQGISVKLVNIEIDGPRVPALRSTWSAYADDTEIGHVTSAAWSPRIETNVAFATVAIDHTQVGQTFAVRVADESTRRTARVVEGWKEH